MAVHYVRSSSLRCNSLESICFSPFCRTNFTLLTLMINLSRYVLFPTYLRGDCTVGYAVNVIYAYLSGIFILVHKTESHRTFRAEASVWLVYKAAAFRHHV